MQAASPNSSELQSRNRQQQRVSSSPRTTHSPRLRNKLASGLISQRMGSETTSGTMDSGTTEETRPRSTSHDQASAFSAMQICTPSTEDPAVDASGVASEKAQAVTSMSGTTGNAVICDTSNTGSTDLGDTSHSMAETASTKMDADVEDAPVDAMEDEGGESAAAAAAGSDASGAAAAAAGGSSTSAAGSAAGSALGAAGSEAMSTDDDDTKPSSTAPSPPALTSKNNPLRKLSVNLLQTYKHINDVYYAKKRRQQEQLQQSGKRKPLNNDGYDDEHGDYKIRVGDTIADRYEIRDAKPLGKGSFGVVVKAFDTKENGWVALKIIKNKKPFHDQAQVERRLLEKFMECGEVVMDRCNIVCFKDQFVHRNHQCLVFELLNLSLYDLLKRTRHQGVSLNLVRKFAKQILNTLQFLAHPSVGIIHCDLKPENVLLRNGISCQVKVIDFGSSCCVDRQMFTYIQSRFYRSPEVLLCMQYGHPIDMWSLGCILVEMHTGHPVFNGRCEKEQICKIVEVLGLPPDSLLKRAGANSRVAQLFETDDEGNRSLVWHGKTIQPSIKPLRATVGVETGGPGGRRKDEVGHTQADYELFLDLIMKMLTYDPVDRIKPADAARHEFFAASASAPAAGAAASSGTTTSASAASTVPSTPATAAAAAPALSAAEGDADAAKVADANKMADVGLQTEAPKP